MLVSSASFRDMFLEAIIRPAAKIRISIKNVRPTNITVQRGRPFSGDGCLSSGVVGSLAVASSVAFAVALLASVVEFAALVVALEAVLGVASVVLLEVAVEACVVELEDCVDVSVGA